MPHVISSLTCGQDFHQYAELSADQLAAGMTPRILKTIKINGGTGVANRAVVTPLGVVTAVSEEDLSILREIPDFKRFEKEGYIAVENSDTAPAPEKFVAGMEVDKRSQPLTLAHFREKDPERPELVTVSDNAQGNKSRSRRAAA